MEAKSLFFSHSRESAEVQRHLRIRVTVIFHTDHPLSVNPPGSGVQESHGPREVKGCVYTAHYSLQFQHRECVLYLGLLVSSKRSTALIISICLSAAQMAIT